ncbi:MAG: molecular chaperone DnaJ [Candidatus Omnitrophica bacterium]|nr:molecular chaperone DnaJ [Candidatus Omnitrophota bacterium]
MMSTKRDYYEILKVNKSASIDDIRRSYREAALKNHPDRVPAEQKKEAEARFKEISEAYAVLSDPQKRSLYDQYGHSGIDQRYAYEDIFKGADFSSVFGGGGFGGIFEDLFEDMGFDIFSGRRSQGGSRRRGRDLQIAVSISLEEAAAGTEKTISVPRYETCKKCRGTGSKPGTSPQVCTQCGGRGRVMMSSGFFQLAQTCPQCRGEGKVVTDPCVDCHGAGRVKRTVKITVKIPPGVDTGSTLRVRGEGEAGSAAAGDLYVNIEIERHKTFQRRDDDIVVSLPITLSKAILGGEVHVPTLDGSVNMKVPAGTQSGKVFRLRGKGIPNLRSRVPGDELVRVEVEIPRRLNNRQRELIEEFARLAGEDVPKETLADRIKKKFT